jgi:exodeoxyribonuclease V alpha subunit
MKTPDRRHEYTPFDDAFAELIGRLQPSADPDLAAAARLVSRAVREREVCFDLAAAEFSVPDIAAKLRTFANVVSADGSTPLVVSGSRLYLQRYFGYERELAAAILRRAGRRADFDPAAAGPLIDAAFPGADTPDHPAFRQKLAMFAAARSRLVIISGGPGTGKTYVAARIIAMLKQLYATAAPVIRLAAPTGKAAARLNEALAAAAIPELAGNAASTIHRLLGGGVDGDFRFDRARPLAADIVLLDEVSMVPLHLLARLFAALPESASVIMLGDMHQLSSVEPGCVFADLCEAADPERCGAAFAADFAAAFGRALPVPAAADASTLADAAVELTVSRRFAPDGKVARASSLINRCRSAAAADAAIAELQRPDPDFTVAPLPALPLASGRGAAAFRRVIAENYRELAAAADPAAAFAALERFRILTATRVGPFGSAAINLLARQLLFGDASPDEFYSGKPVLVLENDYDLGLFNGDVGVVFADGFGQRKVWFPDPAAPGAFRSIPPPLLPAHEEVFAMTVHKSQGSEFDRILLLLPESGEALTRELLYTGITRSRRGVTIFGDAAALRRAVLRKTARASGLADRLRAGR